MQQTASQWDILKERLAEGGGAPSSDYDLNRDLVLPENRKLRDAAVLLPLLERQGAVHVLLTKRSSALKHHPGQIAFPGGKKDADDASLVETALREAREEVGLPSALCSVLGQLPSHETVTGFTVTPVVARILEPFDVVKEAGEVDEVFEVPLAFLRDARNFRAQSRHWRGQRRYYYTVPYGPYYIWGATARILRAFADRIGPE